jgi:predicted small secreted protein
MIESKGHIGLALLAVIAAIGLSACDNTIRGAAADIQDTGSAIEDSADGNPTPAPAP